MFTGPVGPVEVIFYWPEAVFGNFYWPGAIGLLLASSPGIVHQNFIYNSPSEILQIYASFRSYFPKTDWSRRHSSSRSPGMDGLKQVYKQVTCFTRVGVMVLYMMASFYDELYSN